MASGNTFWLQRANLQHPTSDIIEGETVIEEQITTTHSNGGDLLPGQVIDQSIEVKKIVSFNTPGEKVVSIQEAPVNDILTATRALEYGDEVGYPAQWVIEGLANQNHQLREIGRFQPKELEEKIAALVSLDSAKAAKTEDVFWGEDWIIYRKIFKTSDNPAASGILPQRNSELQNPQLINQAEGLVNGHPASSGEIKNFQTTNSFSGEHIIIVRSQKQLSVEERQLEQPVPISNSQSAQPINFGQVPQGVAVPPPAPITGGNPFFAIRPGDIKGIN